MCAFRPGPGQHLKLATNDLNIYIMYTMSPSNSICISTNKLIAKINNKEITGKKIYNLEIWINVPICCKRPNWINRFHVFRCVDHSLIEGRLFSRHFWIHLICVFVTYWWFCIEICDIFILIQFLNNIKPKHPFTFSKMIEKNIVSCNVQLDSKHTNYISWLFSDRSCFYFVLFFFYSQF